MRGRPGEVSACWFRRRGARAYNLVQSLRGTETSRAGTDDKDIDVAGVSGQHMMLEGVWNAETHISLPLALLRVRWWEPMMDGGAGEWEYVNAPRCVHGEKVGRVAEGGWRMRMRMRGRRWWRRGRDDDNNIGMGGGGACRRKVSPASPRPTATPAAPAPAAGLAQRASLIPPRGVGRH